MFDERSSRNAGIQKSLNRGFRVKDNNIFTYSQNRIGFNYFYCKGEVESDGIHTKPLNIILNPWSFENRYIFYEYQENPLSLSYSFKVTHQNTEFKNIEQFVHYKFCLFHNEQEKAREILFCNLFQARNIVQAVSIHQTWYLTLDDILALALDYKLKTCSQFKETLDSINSNIIIYADKHKYLGSGMTLKLTEIAKTKQFPGQNKLGEILVNLKQSTS